MHISPKIFIYASMLINLSNHPSNRWQAEQIQAANALYGSVVDIPFPEVPPMATKEEVVRMAESCVKNIGQTAAPAEATVHIMGEMTLTYAMVTLLKNMGYCCVASTTVREVFEEEPGKKTVLFKFTRFREY